MKNLKRIEEMTIEELLTRPEGKKHRTGGFTLTLKRARKTKEVGKKWLQEVLFLDETGEIEGEILLDKYIPFHSGRKVNIVVCWLQAGEKGPKLYVEQWKQPTWTADEYEASRNMNYSSFDPEDEFVIRGKVRHGVVCAHRQKVGFDEKLTPEQKEVALDDVDFVMTGE